ncbi:MAG: hypothetical protein RQ826_09640 [Xanthomonadales bacterium]|nr:hypothetical protein [Xanthomonadales bacterium]
MTRIVLPLMLLAVVGFSGLRDLAADVLLIEEVRQAGQMPVPTNGNRKEQVKARYGEPVRIHAPVGDPPITRWDYDRWSVYFEYDRVLSTVLHRGAVLDRREG